MRDSEFFQLVRPRGAPLARKGVSFLSFYILYFVSFLFCATHGIMLFSVLTVLHRNKPVQATWAFCSLY